MPRRRVEKTVKDKEPIVGDQRKPQASSINQEVERQSEAIRALRDLEIEHALTGLRSLRSYFSQHLETPVLLFFEENLPNLSVVENGENGKFEVQWKEADDDNRTENLASDAGVEDLHASLLRRLSISYPDYSHLQSFTGFGFSSNAGFLGADNLQTTDSVLEGPSGSQMFGMSDGLHTPGVSRQRLSIGMTPKTVRVPQPGEMLLSVHGSPLGVYKEDNMEAIHGFLTDIEIKSSLVYYCAIQLMPLFLLVAGSTLLHPLQSPSCFNCRV